MLPVPLLRVKDDVSELEHTIPNQYPESRSIGCLTRAVDLGDQSFSPNSPELQKAVHNSYPSEQIIPNDCYTQNAIEDSNAACCNDKLHLKDFCTNSSVRCSYDHSICLNSNDYEYLNQTYKFCVNDFILFNSNKYSFLVSCK